MNMRALVILGAIAAICASATPAQAQAFSNAKTSAVDYTKAESEPKAACDSLVRLKGGEIADLQVRSIAAAGPTPAHCRVNGIIAPEIGFEVNLPAKWNGRFYMIGNGGHAGQGPDDPGRSTERAVALQNGFAFATTNTGHDGQKETGATFVLSNPQKAIDYAHRAVHMTAITAKRIANEYYAKPVSFSYWSSCSNGGRQGLIEAQRYPDDFDGIVANAPWVDQTGFTIGAMWNQRALTEAPLSAEKLALVAKSVMNKCDAVDGLKDGLIDDPRRCSFDPKKDVPACQAGADGGDCLTAAQATTLSKIYGGVTSNGKAFFPGYMIGSEAINSAPNGTASSGWMNLIVSAKPEAKPADFNLAEGTMRYLVFDPPKADYDYKTFDFDKDPALLERWGKIANANNPDLSAFKKRGGRLIMTYGWADSILQPMMGVSYYEQAVAKNGKDTKDFFRLFMIPGMAHCAGGVGPDQNDAVTAVINWVEKKTAPDAIASKIVSGQTMRTRPLCPYPQVARYSGDGSIDEAKNFKCVAPK
jgi:tannase/feruloyl esterase